ncbi:MAG: RNA-dependent RNA polymerase [Hangzhou cletus punctiger lispivirus 1]|uniref:RNA-directed RNA polymerase L n=1 Tax=Hangzhou cletus punctiger lispivirus 1 TaxID=2905566 RepID=A0A8K1XVU9_9MONO|nr:MAG: RNA-dependent RNA polymerase [Hangzhou cletus punctiger lispivirus 1]UHK03163.1 MAG: RNA-dependent RNA polymerase [Hangzhou cletus punctiger lispivirus 1]
MIKLIPDTVQKQVMEDIEYEYSTRREKKPFLPDLHLKSAITDDFSTSIKRVLLDSTIKHPDKKVNDLVSMLRLSLASKLNLKEDQGIDVKGIRLLAGKETVPFYPELWNKMDMRNCKPSISSRIKLAWEKLSYYFEQSKELVAQLIRSIFERLDPQSLKEELLKGVASKLKKKVHNIPKDTLNLDPLVTELSDTTHNVTDEVVSKILQLDYSESITTYFATAERWNRLRSLVIQAQAIQDTKCSFFNLFRDRDTLFHKDIILIFWGDYEVIILDINQLLMITDTINSRFLTLLSTEIYDNQTMKILPARDLVEKIYQWMDSILKLKGNDGYNILKKLESITIAVYLKKFDPLIYSHQFLTNLFQDTEKNDEIYLQQLVEILNRAENPNQLFEIYGLYRHGGHPIVDEVEGCRKMKEVARDSVEIKSKVLVETLGACKKNFILEYMSQHKHWPLIDTASTFLFLDYVKDTGDVSAIVSKSYCGYDPSSTSNADSDKLSDSPKIDKISEFLKQKRKQRKAEVISKKRTQSDKQTEVERTLRMEVDRFKDIISRKPLNLNEYRHSIPLYLWAQISFLKVFEYNDYEDFTNLLSDTAISPPRSKWTMIYNRFLLRCSHTPDYDYSRRTLINILKRNELSMAEIRETISSGKVPSDWLIVAVHSKERELKIAARLFAMMVLEMRMYFASTEKNISDTFFKYVPTQTMTNSEAELTQKLLTLTNINTKQKHLPVMISCDIEKFNMRWRQETTSPFFLFLDELFGLSNYYTYSHHFFEKVFICLASNYHPPTYLKKDYRKLEKQYSDKEEMITHSLLDSLLKKGNYEQESDTTWIGQGGGFEGLRQKGWTFIIASVLQVVEEITNYKSYIIGQGDNQFIVVLFPIDIEGVTEAQYLESYQSLITDRLSCYLDTLKTKMLGIGMKLKLEETWCSTRLLCYGKEILVDGCYTTAILKRISRSYSDVNEIYPTLSTRISSIFSTCHSVSGKSFDSIVPYVIALTLSSFMIDKEIRGDGLIKIDPKKIASTLKQKVSLVHDPLLTPTEFKIIFLLNKEIGGYPILPITEFLFRGHPDPVNSYFSTLTPQSSMEEMLKVIMYILTNYRNKIETPINYKKLIQDPTTLNWKNDHMDTGVLSNILEDNLRRLVNNKDIKILFDTADKDSTTSLINYLSSCEPFVPRVLNEIFRHSPEGSKLKYLSIFSDMKTMKEMLSAREGFAFIQSIEDQEVKLLNSIFTIVKEIKDITVNQETIALWNNSFLRSEEITNVMWDKEVKGSRIPHPLQQSIFVPIENGKCTLCDHPSDRFKEHIAYVFSSKNLEKPPESKQMDFYFKRGAFNPYLGSTTREKRSRSLINFPKGDKALLAAQSLQRIRDWVVEKGGNLDEFIKEIIESRTNIPIQTIQLASGRWYGGSIVHRFQDVITKHSCRPNTRPNLFSNIYITSDGMGIYSSGRENYNIHFQSCYLLGFSLINMLNIWDPTNETVTYHLHFPYHHAILLSDVDKLETSAVKPRCGDVSNCRLLFSTINEFVDNRIEFYFGNKKIISPSSHPLLLNDGAHWAAATIIYANLLETINPLLQMHNVKQNTEQTKCPLTIDDLMNLSLSKVMRLLGQLWYLDNLRDITQILVEEQLEPKTLIYGLLSKIPVGALRFLRSLFCHESIRDKLIAEFGWPSSSNFVVTANSIDQLFIHSMYEGAIRTRKHPTPIPFIFPHGCLRFNRWLLIYFNSLLNTSFKKDPYPLLKYIDKISTLFYKLLENNQNNVRSFLVKYNELMSTDNRLRPIGEDFPNISSCGCEPWIRDYKKPGPLKIQELPVKKIVFLTLSDIERLNSIRKRQEKLFDLVREIEPKIDTNITQETAKLSKENYDLMDAPFHFPIVKRRLTHQDRLTGLYSTAHYKYLEILRTIDKKTFSICVNLAEGAGGVAKLCAEIFNPDWIIYNSLLNLEDFLPQKALSYVPPELLNTYWHKMKKILGVNICLETGGDLNKSIVINRIVKLIQTHAKGPVLMTFDAELGNLFSPRDLFNLLGQVSNIINVLPLGSYIILKTFYYYFNTFSIIVGSLAKYYGSVRIIKPSYSSNENSEIFLIIKKKLDCPNPVVWHYFTNLDFSIFRPNLNVDSINEVNSETKSKLHISLREIGFQYNLGHALKNITNYSINLKKFFQEPMLEISNCIDFHISLIQLRFDFLGKSLINKNLTDLQRFIRLRNLKESKELEQLGETFVNLLILRSLIVTGDIDESIIHTQYSIHDQLLVGQVLPDSFLTYQEAMLENHKKHLSLIPEVLYTIQVRPDEWANKYMRHFQKIKGYLCTVNMWNEGKCKN